MCNLHRIQASQLLCCFAVVLEMPAHKYELGRKETIHQMSLFKQFNRCHRFVASPHKSGEPSLRLFQPCLSCRQTSLSQPCSRLTGVVFQGALSLPRGFASDDGWRDVKSNSQQIECTICTESKLASSCAALLLCSRCQQYELEKKINNPSNAAI